MSLSRRWTMPARGDRGELRARGAAARSAACRPSCRCPGARPARPACRRRAARRPRARSRARSPAGRTARRRGSGAARDDDALRRRGPCASATAGAPSTRDPAGVDPGPAAGCASTAAAPRQRRSKRWPAAVAGKISRCVAVAALAWRRIGGPAGRDGAGMRVGSGGGVGYNDRPSRFRRMPHVRIDDPTSLPAASASPLLRLLVALALAGAARRLRPAARGQGRDVELVAPIASTSSAHDAMLEGNYTRAIKLFETLEARFPYGRYAQQAILESRVRELPRRRDRRRHRRLRPLHPHLSRTIRTSTTRTT